jgi:hypothetical protein
MLVVMVGSHRLAGTQMQLSWRASARMPGVFQLAQMMFD